jgi:hypothetical protein
VNVISADVSFMFRGPVSKAPEVAVCVTGSLLVQQIDAPLAIVIGSGSYV